MKEQLQVARKRLDALIKALKQLPETTSRNHAITNLTEARFLLGNALNLLGVQPYSNHALKTGSVLIDKPADLAEAAEPIDLSTPESTIKSIKWLRNSLETFLQKFHPTFEETITSKKGAALFIDSSRIKVHVSKSWLGYMLLDLNAPIGE